MRNCQPLREVEALGDAPAFALVRDSRCGPDSGDPPVCCPDLSLDQPLSRPTPRPTRRPTPPDQYGAGERSPEGSGSRVREGTQPNIRYPQRGQSTDSIAFPNSEDERSTSTTTTSRPTRGQTDVTNRQHSGNRNSSAPQCGQVGLSSTDRIVGGDGAALGKSKGQP